MQLILEPWFIGLSGSMRFWSMTVSFLCTAIACQLQIIDDSGLRSRLSLIFQSIVSISVSLAWVWVCGSADYIGNNHIVSSCAYKMICLLWLCSNLSVIALTY